MFQPDAPLCVHLEVGIEVVVSERSFNASGCPVRELVGSGVRVIVREPDANGNRATVICRTDIPAIGGVAQEPRMIGTVEIRPKRGAGGRVAIVCGDTESTEHSG